MIKESNYKLQITINKDLLKRVKEHLHGETSMTNYIVNLIRNDLDKKLEN